MAEQRNRSSDGAKGNGRLNAARAVAAVRKDFPGLFGRPLESVLGVRRGEDGGWEVTVQVVELERIPRSTDVLGAYVVELDDEGELVGYERRRRYHRSQADED